MIFNVLKLAVDFNVFARIRLPGGAVAGQWKENLPLIINVLKLAVDFDVFARIRLRGGLSQDNGKKTCR